ncbi:hypothetical protein [Dyadobacter frigoris]|uniref:Uncharacterized protein n=1 Tax=Dyadobacter frigoris TaxID=2576211 RepID=A0A4U6CZX0_9BACT|nr:hypothetical protein [Dyadobacter frigoris]TKT87014.1 hypothetical protein FDK13_30840 [Dyadobacter frigoris]GLU52788.1 hypothetical protein Dfri01_22490 [Dyadobacter frigoris]
MRFIIKAPFYFILLFFFVSSCSKGDDEDCGCDGSTYRTIENLQARYSGDGTFVVPDTNVGFLKVSACDVDTAWEISKDEKTWNYTISGNITKTCLGPNPELRLPPSGGPIQITDIKKM